MVQVFSPLACESWTARPRFFQFYQLLQDGVLGHGEALETEVQVQFSRVAFPLTVAEQEQQGPEAIVQPERPTFANAPQGFDVLMEVVLDGVSRSGKGQLARRAVHDQGPAPDEAVFESSGELVPAGVVEEDPAFGELLLFHDDEHGPSPESRYSWACCRASSRSIIRAVSVRRARGASPSAIFMPGPLSLKIAGSA